MEAPSEHLLQNGPCFCGAVDVTCVQGTSVVGCLAQFFMKLELQDEADKIPAGERVALSSLFSAVFKPFKTFHEKFHEQLIKGCYN